MFYTSILDVALGLVFVFLAVSMAASAATEALASALKWRSSTLLKGIQDLLNDPDFNDLAAELYSHALINPRGPGMRAAAGPPGAAASPATPLTVLGILKSKDKTQINYLISDLKINMPAYIQPNQFADAFMDLLSLRPAAGSPPVPDSLLNAINLRVPADQYPQVNQLLVGIIQRTEGDMTKIRTEISNWFINAMDRVSGVYKRHTQLVGFLAALAISAALNVDSLHVAQRIWAQPALVDTITAANTPPDTIQANQQSAKNLPLGWTDVSYFYEKDPVTGNPIVGKSATISSPAVVLAGIGWFITALASLFGAPFWFDSLQQIIRLKGSGPSPAEKANNTAAAG